ncbi:MAG: twin-arginine translocase TatA/TatE family subunit [Myxococcales bacterium]|nr:twin-arginine translocase TatA/TatE family subunit [Myxococcales bacterium]
MFGISLSEVALIAMVALVVVGPKKLPGMLRTLGEWVRKIRLMTTQVRAQTGIDDILRQEGIDGGIAELRGLIRGDLALLSRARTGSGDAAPVDDPYESAVELDRYREYPPEGPDACGALPDDLWDEPEPPAPTDASAPKPEPEEAERAE